MRFLRLSDPGSRRCSPPLRSSIRLRAVSATDDVRRLIPAAMDRFGARVRAVPEDRWDSPTPCSEWNVRDLVARSQRPWA
jgi:hypothetical protein